MQLVSIEVRLRSDPAICVGTMKTLSSVVNKWKQDDRVRVICGKTIHCGTLYLDVATFWVKTRKSQTEYLVLAVRDEDVEMLKRSRAFTKSPQNVNFALGHNREFHRFLDDCLVAYNAEQQRREASRNRLEKLGYTQTILGLMKTGKKQNG